MKRGRGRTRAHHHQLLSGLRRKTNTAEGTEEGTEEDDRWLRGSFTCPACRQVFTTRLKMQRHHRHVHLGLAPWQGSHPLRDLQQDLLTEDRATCSPHAQARGPQAVPVPGV
ncbi:hypothetical protein Pcinc_026727 [Petrolisthes cinctipes]|uniref:C2H2-type domain-containing protein n=1 Tax=Petrolisthes cinctipes TaxID=88211 RepID=A0AAE1F5B2_PETCI|nr:hypothetical protein Pcinc_026727 [Petrolisthes cinctipes]